MWNSRGEEMQCYLIVKMSLSVFFFFLQNIYVLHWNFLKLSTSQNFFQLKFHLPQVSATCMKFQKKKQNNIYQTSIFADVCHKLM